MPDALRTIIAGGRDVTDPALLHAALAACGWQVGAVVSGAARGADALGIAWARAHGVPLTRYPANWHRHGRAAGPLRNAEMAKDAEALVALDTGGPGTADMIRRARAAGLRVYVHNCRPNAA